MLMSDQHHGMSGNRWRRLYAQHRDSQATFGIAMALIAMLFIAGIVGAFLALYWLSAIVGAFRGTTGATAYAALKVGDCFDIAAAEAAKIGAGQTLSTIFSATGN